VGRATLLRKGLEQALFIAVVVVVVVIVEGIDGRRFGRGGGRCRRRLTPPKESPALFESRRRLVVVVVVVVVVVLDRFLFLLAASETGNHQARSTGGRTSIDPVPPTGLPAVVVAVVGGAVALAVVVKEPIVARYGCKAVPIVVGIERQSFLAQWGDLVRRFQIHGISIAVVHFVRGIDLVLVLFLFLFLILARKVANVLGRVGMKAATTGMGIVIHSSLVVFVTLDSNQLDSTRINSNQINSNQINQSVPVSTTVRQSYAVRCGAMWTESI